MKTRTLAFDPTPERLARPLRRQYKGEWKRIRDRRFTQGGLACELCGVEQPGRETLDAHEVYDLSRPGVIRLAKIQFLCLLCHSATHLERTRHKAQSKEWISAVEAHYCKVNDVSREQLERDFAAMMERSAAIKKSYAGKAKPVMDYGEYQAGADASEKRKRSDDDDGGFEMYPDHECPWDVGHAD